MSWRAIVKAARKVVAETMAYPGSVILADGSTERVEVRWNREIQVIGAGEDGYSDVSMAGDQLIFWLEDLPEGVGERGQMVEFDSGQRFQILNREAEDEFTQTYNVTRLL